MRPCICSITRLAGRTCPIAGAGKPDPEDALAPCLLSMWSMVGAGQDVRVPQPAPASLSLVL